MSITVAEVVLIAVASALSTAVFNTLFFYFVSRREKTRDLKISKLRDRVSDLETEELERVRKSIEDVGAQTLERLMQCRSVCDEKINKVGDSVIHAAKRREKIYKKMDEDLIHRREFTEAEERHQVELEKIDKRLNAINAVTTDISAEVAGTGATVKLIADHLKIGMGD